MNAAEFDQVIERKSPPDVEELRRFALDLILEYGSSRDKGDTWVVAQANELDRMLRKVSSQRRKTLLAILRATGAVLGFAAFITLVLVVLPDNQLRERNDAQRHVELIAAVEQMTAMCEP